MPPIEDVAAPPTNVAASSPASRLTTAEAQRVALRLTRVLAFKAAPNARGSRPPPRLASIVRSTRVGDDIRLEPLLEAVTGVFGVRLSLAAPPYGDPDERDRKLVAACMAALAYDYGALWETDDGDRHHLTFYDAAQFARAARDALLSTAFAVVAERLLMRTDVTYGIVGADDGAAQLVHRIAGDLVARTADVDVLAPLFTVDLAAHR